MRAIFLFAIGIILLPAIMGCGREKSHKFDEPLPGLTEKLAVYRAKSISNLQYQLKLNFPDTITSPIRGEETIHFILKNQSHPLVLDFKNASKLLKSVAMNGQSVLYQAIHGHIIIPAANLTLGNNYLTLSFDAGNDALNRNPEYMYSLFVPALASTAFPCFDQPDMKAGIQLQMNIPAKWTAVSNAPLIRTVKRDERAIYYFGQSPPISTYQFAFAAGKYKIMTGKRAGRTFHMYYRETNQQKINRNIGQIFDLESQALEWLEKYTGITYPYDKFDFVAIPSFQFGGMEHPGAIYYKASELFLTKSATLNDSLRRANLISHETSHMWFGDMVTMKWFNDVWTKEVYAQFMADKIVQLLFPKINFDQRFLLSHYPSAYAKDRSEGAEPIRQPLQNLLNASNMYVMAYDKAPIVMRQLEQIIGRKKFQKGLRKYLNTFRYSNATWRDLISILNNYTDRDLKQWNRIWVEQSGRPVISIKRYYNSDGTLKNLKIKQEDPWGKQRVWPQQLNILLYYGNNKDRIIPVYMDEREITVIKVNGLKDPDFILANGRGMAYGMYQLNGKNIQQLMKELPEIKNATVQSISWLTLWDNFLKGSIPAEKLMHLSLKVLQYDINDLNVNLILKYVDRIYWQYLPEQKRAEMAPMVENILWNQMQIVSSSSLKSSFFQTFRDIATTRKGLNKLQALWSKKKSLKGLNFSENDYVEMVAHLAITQYPGWKKMLADQENRIKDSDRLHEFQFVRPALSDNPMIRKQFFDSLRKPANRMHEPWVLKGLHYLNHPLRSPDSDQYILPGLEMLKEIQATGDIFFPGRWVDAILHGHHSKKAAQTVRKFLNERANYPHFLKDKILQAADPLFRSSQMLQKNQQIVSTQF